jgi:hypothetical protein
MMRHLSQAITPPPPRTQQSEMIRFFHSQPRGKNTVFLKNNFVIKKLKWQGEINMQDSSKFLFLEFSAQVASRGLPWIFVT